MEINFEPFRAIVRCLTPLVHGNRSYWTDAVCRWAADPPHHGDRGILPVPLPVKLTDDERIALLAAIYDACVTEAARIDPWRDPRDLPDLPDDPRDAISGEYQLAIRYAILVRDRVPMLRLHWHTHEAAIEMFIADAERDLAKHGERAAQVGMGGADAGFIERLLAGPNDVELTPRELAMLEAHLKQPVSLAQMQREAKAGTKETATARNKLKLIRDFNRRLQRSLVNTSDATTEAGLAVSGNAAAVAQMESVSVDAKPKRRGWRKANYATVQREAQLAADWEQAREAGVYKPTFAKEHGMTTAKLDALLDRVAKRKSRSDK